jgi:hypothetical protein
MLFAQFAALLASSELVSPPPRMSRTKWPSHGEKDPRKSELADDA